MYTFFTIKMMGGNAWHQKRSHSSFLKITLSILDDLYLEFFSLVNSSKCFWIFKVVAELLTRMFFSSLKELLKDFFCLHIQLFVYICGDQTVTIYCHTMFTGPSARRRFRQLFVQFFQILICFIFYLFLLLFLLFCFFFIFFKIKIPLIIPFTDRKQSMVVNSRVQNKFWIIMKKIQLCIDNCLKCLSMKEQH